MSKDNASSPASEPLMSAHERIEWLLQFLRLDIQNLRPGELLDLRTDVANFCFSSGQVLTAILSPDRDSDVNLFLFTGEGGEEQKSASDPAWNLVWELQIRVVVGVNSLREGEVWKPFDPAHEGRAPAPEWELEVRSDGTLSRRYQGTIRAAFVAAAADALQEYWPQLRYCKHEPCGALFLPDHGSKYYHEPGCSQRARSKKFEPKRKRKKRDYHAEYISRSLSKDKKKGAKHGSG